MILTVLKTMLQHFSEFIFSWDAFISHVTNTINIKIIKIHSFFSAQLLLEFKSCHTADMQSEYDEIKETAITVNVKKIMNNEKSWEKAQYITKLTIIDEMQQQAIKKWIQKQEQMIIRTEKSEKTSEEEDLILMQWLTQNNQHSHKLKSRWERSYLMTQIERHEKSA